MSLPVKYFGLVIFTVSFDTAPPRVLLSRLFSSKIIRSLLIVSIDTLSDFESSAAMTLLFFDNSSRINC